VATLKVIQIAAQGNNSTASATSYSISAGGTSSQISIGANQHIRIVATTPINVRFGPTGLNTATASDILIPANVESAWDMGSFNSSICIYAAAAATVSVAILSKV
jgi:hypothetical protein